MVNAIVSQRAIINMKPEISIIFYPKLRDASYDESAWTTSPRCKFFPPAN